MNFNRVPAGRVVRTQYKRHDLSVLAQKSLIMSKILGQTVYMLLMYQSYLNQKYFLKLRWLFENVSL